MYSTLKFITKGGLFLIYFLPLCYFTTKYGPTIIFYFDQVEGVAEINYVDKSKVKFNYFHKEKNKNIHLHSKIS